MISKRETLNERLKWQQFGSTSTNFILNVRHIDPDNRMKIGDVHSYNAKLDEKVNVYAVYDDVNQTPTYLGTSGNDFLKSSFSIEVFHWEKVETTTALHQQNSRGVSAYRMCRMLGVDVPTGVPLEISAKSLERKHNKPKYHTMLSTGASKSAKILFKEKHLGEYDYELDEPRPNIRRGPMN